MNVKYAINDGDADVLIVNEALSVATHTKVVAHSVDTDVFIALLYHSSNNKNEILMSTKKGLVSIDRIATKFDDGVKECLLFSHAISGCDTVSATFGIGKTKAFRKLSQSTE